MMLSKLPEDVMTQDKLKSSGKSVVVKGVLSGDECKGKAIRIDALQKPDGRTPILLAAVLSRKDIGSFEMLVPKSDQPVWIVANCDVNGDDQIIFGTDMTAAYAKNPVTPSGPVEGVELSFTKERITVGMPPGPPELEGNGAPPPPGGGPENGAPAPADGSAPPPAGAPPGGK